MTFFSRIRWVALLACPGIAAAQTVLRLPASTRALGMGNVAVVGRDDDVLFYNPSQLVIARGMSAAMERLSATATSGTLASVIRFNTGGIAVGMNLVDFESAAAQTDLLRSQMIAPGLLAGTSVEAAVGLAQVFKSVRWGLAGKYVEDNVGGARDGRAMVDVGLSRDFLRFYTAGVSVQDIALRTHTPVTRPRVTAGGGTSRALGIFDATATAAVIVERYNLTTHVAPAGGGELGWSWIDGYSVVVRAGARSPLAGERVFTAGGGFNADRLSIDYALETLTAGRAAHRVGLRIR